jgi:type I restriction enzyme M protein
MEDADVHTVLRCPRGAFNPYTDGTKTNVIFFTKGCPTTKVWVYDARANVPKITKKSRPLTDAYFTEFEACYGTDPKGQSVRKESHSTQDRWRVFDIDDVKARNYKIDSFRWLRDEELDDPDDIGDPVDLLAEGLVELRSAIGELVELQKFLGDEVEA